MLLEVDCFRERDVDIRDVSARSVVAMPVVMDASGEKQQQTTHWKPGYVRNLVNHFGTMTRSSWSSSHNGEFIELRRLHRCLAEVV